MKTHSRKLLGLTKNDEYLSKRNNTSNTTAISESTTIEETTTPTKDGLRSPILGFDTSMTLTVLVALFFMVLFSIYFRRFADDDQDSLEISPRASRRRQLNRRRSDNSSTSSSNSLSVRSNRQAGLDSLTIKSLPLFAYEHGNSSEAQEEESIDCVVCLSEFEERETVKMIPHCGHVFHPECIDTWFSSNVSCPLCRSTKLFSSTSIAKNKNHDDSDRQFHDHHQVMEDTTDDDTSVVAERGLEGLSHIIRNSSWPKMQKENSTILTRSSSF